jgi:hypothetical protein
MSAQIILLHVPMSEADYRRPALTWIKRRARRLQRFFHCSRRVAITEAMNDYDTFSGEYRARLLKLIKGGCYGKGR